MAKQRANQGRTFQFDSKYLNAVYSAFVKRQKAIAYWGCLTYEFGYSGDREWLIIIHGSYDYPSIELYIDNEHNGEFKIFSGESRNYGKILGREKLEKLGYDTTRLVEAFENTIPMSRDLRPEGDEQKYKSICGLWSGIGLKLSE